MEMSKGCACPARAGTWHLTAPHGAESPVLIPFRHFQRNSTDRISPCVSTSTTTLIVEVNCDDLSQPPRMAPTDAGYHPHRLHCGDVRLRSLSPCNTLVPEIALL